MTWVKLDDAFPSHPKVDALSDGAFRLHVTALCWCCQWLTDGVVPAERLRSLPGYRYKASHVAELLTPRPPDGRAAWVEVEGGYQIHDFLEYQIPAAKVRADRAAAAERMRRHRTEAEPTADVRANKQRTNGEVRSVFGDPVPGPYPSRPEPEEKPSPSVFDLGGKTSSCEAHGAAADAAAACSADFERFWLAYPKRNGKRDKRKGAEGKWQRLTKANRSASLAAVANYATHCERTGELAADAVAWLNQERWTDFTEPTEVHARTNGHQRGPSSMDFFALGAEMRAERTQANDDVAAWPEEMAK